MQLTYCRVCGVRLPRSAGSGDCPLCGCLSGLEVPDLLTRLDHRYCRMCGLPYLLSAFVTGRDFTAFPLYCAWCGDRAVSRWRDKPRRSLDCDVPAMDSRARYCGVCGGRLTAHRRADCP